MNEDQLREWLPAYLNGSLPASQRRLVQAWLDKSPAAQAELDSWRKLRRAVQGQALARPAPDARARLMGRLGDQPQVVRRAGFLRLSGRALAGAMLTLVVLVLLWVAVQPGVALQWTVEGDGVAAFKVYRAERGTQQFVQLAEIPVQADSAHYRFVDGRLWPGQAYVYRVEGVGQSGEIAVSRAITSGPLAALPGQLAILFTSLVVGFSLSALARLWVGGRVAERSGLPI